MANFIGKAPTECQLCLGPIKESFIDGRIRGTSQWAYMCTHCHRAEGVGLGAGLGQMYVLNKEKESENYGKWVKIKG